MKSEGEKVKSLQWAIDELSKQKEELDGKLNIALKREETGSLIEEVHAQKEALEQRISALQDGLKVSSELVDTPVEFLEEEISKVNDKLEIAQERLSSLEQEQYLEELGKKLNRSQDLDDTSGSSLSNELSPGEPNISINPAESSGSLEFNPQPLSSTTQTMSTQTNRVETERESKSRISTEVQETHLSPVASTDSIAVEGLEETASRLGVEPEFLVEKGTKALLRMIARNGGQLRFPLEIDQID